MTDKLIQIVERYFSRLRDEHGLGAGTDERSYYPALAELLNALGQELKPKVLCLSDLANTGAGHPDFGLYAANQVQKGEPRKGQPPERGVIEMKGVDEETWFTAESRQVSKYFGAYQLVVVSNLRAFLIVGEGPTGEATKLEGFRLAPTAKVFWVSRLLCARCAAACRKRWRPSSPRQCALVSRTGSRSYLRRGKR